MYCEGVEEGGVGVGGGSCGGGDGGDCGGSGGDYVSGNGWQERNCYNQFEQLVAIAAVRVSILIDLELLY